VALHALRGRDDNHLARFDLSDEFSADNVERAGFRRKCPSIADLAQDEWAHTQGIAAPDQFGAGHRNDGKRAFDFTQGFFHPVGDVAAHGARHQVDDTFAVRW